MIHVFIKHVGEQETIFFRIGNSNNIVIDLQKCNTTGYKGVNSKHSNRIIIRAYT